MMKHFICLISVLILFSACRENNKKHEEKHTAPIVSNDGQTISFPDKKNIKFFNTEKVNCTGIITDFTAIGEIAAIVVSSNSGGAQSLILFENPELESNFTQLIQHQINISQIQNINIKQKQIELERTKDLQKHGAATGQDLLNAQSALSMEQTNLANEKAALIEHEARLESGGFHPEILKKAKVGNAFVICDIPENQISKIKEGDTCDIQFTAFPDEKFTGKIDGVVNAIDNLTRMVKIRISVDRSSNKLKAGMFANVKFSLREGSSISIDKNALVTVQGKNYVFIKTNATDFQRKEIQTGQQIGDRFIVFSGLNAGDEIAVEGVMQLKGLSFGY
jgi:membrane fusion protein, heavy metal efflux system